MFSRIYSFKFIISVALLWMGALAYGLAIYSTQVYRDHAIGSQMESLQTLLELQSRKTIDQLYERQKQFAFQLQGEKEFRNAIDEGDQVTMQERLREAFNRFPVASGEFSPKTMVVRDLSGQIFAQHSDRDSRQYAGCSLALENIGGLVIQQLKPAYTLCSFEGQLYSEVLVPIGSFEPKGYLQVVSYAVEGLAAIENLIDIPLLITNAKGEELYRSRNWVADSPDTHLYPVYKLYGDDAFLGASIMAAYDRFYKGDLGAEYAHGSQEQGGLITAEDLASWSVKFEEPVSANYKGIEVFKLTTWTQGPALLQALNILGGIDLRPMGYNSARYIHALYQAISLAMADRDFYYGDPRVAPEEPIRGLLSKNYARARRDSIDWEKNDPDIRPGDPYQYQRGRNPYQELLEGWSNVETSEVAAQRGSGRIDPTGATAFAAGNGRCIPFLV